MTFFNLILLNGDLCPFIRRVRFSNCVKIKYYYPFATDDEKKRELWWEVTDVELAKKCARNDIIRLITIHPTMSVKDATTLLYQPNNLTYNIENFII